LFLPPKKILRTKRPRRLLQCNPKFLGALASIKLQPGLRHTEAHCRARLSTKGYSLGLCQSLTDFRPKSRLNKKQAIMIWRFWGNGGPHARCGPLSRDRCSRRHSKACPENWHCPTFCFELGPCA